MEKILNEILSKLNTMENNINDMRNDIGDIKIDIKNLKEGQGRIEEKVNSIDSKLDDLEPKNATRHSEINLKIDSMSKDMKFIKHKLHETEEDVFDIKDHLKIIK